MTLMARFLVFLGWLITLAAVALVLTRSTGPLLEAVDDATAGPDATVAAVAALAAWATLGWLCLGLALTLVEAAAAVGARRPRLARLAAAVTPVMLRSAVHASLRAGLVAGTLSGGVVTPTLAWAAPAPAAEVRLSDGSPAVRLADDRQQPRWPSLDRPAHAVPPPVAPRTDAGNEPASDYRVRSGDTLWSIAARHLPRGASDAQIARAWPRWWQANRSVIGPDPGLIRPRQVLIAPGTSTPGASTSGATS